MRFLILCLLLALLGSCTQDPTKGTTSVSGQVVESTNKQPVPNARVQVYHASAGGGYAVPTLLMRKEASPSPVL